MAKRKKYDYVVAVNYYLPHVSGLTDVARRILEELASRGLSVCVICQRHDKTLLKFETIDCVDVIRASVIARVNNGLISISFPFLVRRFAKHARLLHLHAPMLEAGLISLISPTTKLVTYHCDLVAENSLFGRIVEKIVDTSSRISLRRARCSVVSSNDYAVNSRIRSALKSSTAIAPPIQVRRSRNSSFRASSGFHYGFLGRIAPEKGLINLVAAFSSMARVDDRLLIAGNPVSSDGEQIYRQLRASSERDPRIVVIGFVPELAVGDFYASIDAFVFPSINSLEAFGIAQAEAKALGIPLVTSDLPGVRTMIDSSTTGVLVRPGNIAELSIGLEKVRTFERQPQSDAAHSGLGEYVNLVYSLLGGELQIDEDSGRQKN